MNGENIAAIAYNEVGYCEAPTDSNNTKYGAWFGLNGLPWCGIFVSWVYFKAGNKLPNIGFSKGFAGCVTAVKYFRENKKIVTKPQKGDIVFFDWNGDGRFDHTGIFIKAIDKNTFITVEGNTSLTNQSNGGEVMERIRKFNKNTIFVRI